MSQVFVDDMAPSVVRTGSWRAGGSPGRNFNDTVSSTTSPGGTLALTFTGSSIAVYGTIDSLSAGAISTYAIDGGTPVPVVAPSVGGDTYNQSFWDSGSISHGQHTLVVTMTKVNAESEPGEGTIWFDYFVYDTTRGSSGLPSASSSTSSSSAAISPSAKPANKTNVAGIIGGAVVALLVMGFFIAWLIFRWRNTRRHNPKSISSVAPPSSYTGSTRQYNEPYTQTIPTPPLAFTSTTPNTVKNTPYTHTFNNSQTTLHSANPSIPATGGRTPIFSSTTPSASTHGLISGTTPSPWQPAAQGASQLARSGSTSKRRELVVLTYDGDENADADTSTAFAPVVTQHVDSGMRTASGRTGPVVELPPVYTPN